MGYLATRTTQNLRCSKLREHDSFGLMTLDKPGTISFMLSRIYQEVVINFTRTVSSCNKPLLKLPVNDSHRRQEWTWNAMHGNVLAMCKFEKSRHSQVVISKYIYWLLDTLSPSDAEPRLNLSHICSRVGMQLSRRIRSHNLRSWWYCHSRLYLSSTHQFTWEKNSSQFLGCICL